MSELHRSNCEKVLLFGAACDCDELDKLEAPRPRTEQAAEAPTAPAVLWPQHPACKKHIPAEEGGCDWCQNQFELDSIRDSRSERERVLLDGIELTGGDRNKTYGAPAPNLALQLNLWNWYKSVAGEKHSAAHDAAMQHVFAKIARIATGKRGHRDNYVDAATYIAIAFECDATEDEGKKT